MRRLSLGAVALAVALGAPPARADDPAAAQALFTEAKKLMGEKKYADACPKLEESERLGPATGTKFNLADCYEHVGRTASAWAGFLSVAAASKNSNQPAREKAARDRAKALEPKLSRIAIVVPDATNVSGLTVKRDDEEVGSAEWGEALPVDPGQHTITAVAPGKRAWKGIVEVAPEGGSAKVIVPPLDDEPAPPPAPAAAPLQATPAVAASPPPPSEGSSSSAQTAGWVLVATGAVFAVGGGVFWALRSQEVSNLSSECPSGQCNAALHSDVPGEISAGKAYDALSVAFFAVGGAALVTGAGVLVFSGRHRASASAQILPIAGPHGGGLGLAGTF